jgi:hypothetical protein
MDGAGQGAAWHGRGRRSMLQGRVIVILVLFGLCSCARSPEAQFRRYIADPIPPGVHDINGRGGRHIFPSEVMFVATFRVENQDTVEKIIAVRRLNKGNDVDLRSFKNIYKMLASPEEYERWKDRQGQLHRLSTEEDDRSWYLYVYSNECVVIYLGH